MKEASSQWAGLGDMVKSRNIYYIVMQNCYWFVKLKLA